MKAWTFATTQLYNKLDISKALSYGIFCKQITVWCIKHIYRILEQKEPYDATRYDIFTCAQKQKLTKWPA